MVLYLLLLLLLNIASEFFMCYSTSFWSEKHCKYLSSINQPGKGYTRIPALLV
jgi:hypothetical protein